MYLAKEPLFKSQISHFCPNVQGFLDLGVNLSLGQSISWGVLGDLVGQLFRLPSGTWRRFRCIRYRCKVILGRTIFHIVFEEYRCFTTICYVHISSWVTGKWWPYIRHCKKTWDNEVSVWIKTCVEQLFIVCWRHIDTCLLITCCLQVQAIENIVWLLTYCDYETEQSC